MSPGLSQRVLLLTAAACAIVLAVSYSTAKRDPGDAARLAAVARDPAPDRGDAVEGIEFDDSG